MTVDPSLPTLSPRDRAANVIKTRFVQPGEESSDTPTYTEWMWCVDRGDGTFALETRPTLFPSLKKGDIVAAYETTAVYPQGARQASSQQTFRLWTFDRLVEKTRASDIALHRPTKNGRSWRDRLRALTACPHVTVSHASAAADVTVGERADPVAVARLVAELETHRLVTVLGHTWTETHHAALLAAGARGPLAERESPFRGHADTSRLLCSCCAAARAVREPPAS